MSISNKFDASFRFEQSDTSASSTPPGLDSVRQSIFGKPGDVSGIVAPQKSDVLQSSDNLLKVRSEVPETPEQRLNRRMTEVFGADVMEHLNADGAVWLRDNAQKIRDGLAKVSGREAWDMACAMRDRTKLPDGNHVIFLSKQDSPTRGNLIPKRHEVYIRGYRFYHSDTPVGHVYPR